MSLLDIFKNQEDTPTCFGAYARENDDCWDCTHPTACKMVSMKDKIRKNIEVED